MSKVTVHIDGISYGMDSITLGECYINVIKNDDNEIVQAQINFDSTQVINIRPDLFDGMTSLKTCAVTNITIDDNCYFVEWQGYDDDRNERVNLETSDREAWYILSINPMEAM
ncbi:MAG: hypothetical protein ACRC1P_09445 [Cellulosilyticaceae bacterium]